MSATRRRVLTALALVLVIAVAVSLAGRRDHGGVAALDGSGRAAIESPPPPETPPDRCREALAWVANAGLRLPAGVDYRCPSSQFAHHGAACWDAAPCPGGGFIAVNLELLGNSSPEYLRHVVAHEVCHILEFRSEGTSTEESADACAAAHGAPR